MEAGVVRSVRVRSVGGVREDGAVDRDLQKRWIKAWFKAARLGEAARYAVMDARFGPSRCAAKNSSGYRVET